MCDSLTSSDICHRLDENEFEFFADNEEKKRQRFFHRAQPVANLVNDDRTCRLLQLTFGGVVIAKARTAALDWYAKEEAKCN